MCKHTRLRQGALRVSTLATVISPLASNSNRTATCTALARNIAIPSVRPPQRAHPELNQLTSFFLAKVIEDRPESIVEYAAGFFTQKDLKSQVDTAVEEARAAARRVQGKK